MITFLLHLPVLLTLGVLGLLIGRLLLSRFFCSLMRPPSATICPL